MKDRAPSTRTTPTTTARVTDEQYGELCNIVERAWHNWPVVRTPGEADVLHTSDYARAAANTILAVLNLDTEDSRAITRAITSARH
jgi:hypothetical protein